MMIMHLFAPAVDAYDVGDDDYVVVVAAADDEYILLQIIYMLLLQMMMAFSSIMFRIMNKNETQNLLKCSLVFWY